MAKAPMHVIVVAATKGGVGKTTLTSALSVRAAQESKRVALIDADNGQGSLERWWELRGEPSNPQLFEMDSWAEGLGLLISEGWEWVFVDTPTGSIDRIAQALLLADFVLIPSRAGAYDVEAVTQVSNICKELKKPFAFVINAAQPTWKLTKTAAQYLEGEAPDGYTGPRLVLDTMINYRRAWISAITVGKSGAETDKDGKAKAEIDGLWKEIKARLPRVRGK